MTSTRCSSTPGADGLVNADGSIRRTRPNSERAPPHPPIMRAVPTLTATASVVSKSTTTLSARVGDVHDVRRSVGRSLNGIGEGRIDAPIATPR